MSETEINEDNCVLDELDLKLVQEYINMALLAAKVSSRLDNRSLETIRTAANKIFLKINKLNNIVKEIDHETQKS